MVLAEGVSIFMFVLWFIYRFLVYNHCFIGLKLMIVLFIIPTTSLVFKLMIALFIVPVYFRSKPMVLWEQKQMLWWEQELMVTYYCFNSLRPSDAYMRR